MGILSQSPSPAEVRRLDGICRDVLAAIEEAKLQPFQTAGVDLIPAATAHGILVPESYSAFYLTTDFILVVSPPRQVRSNEVFLPGGEYREVGGKSLYLTLFQRLSPLEATRKEAEWKRAEEALLSAMVAILLSDPGAFACGNPMEHFARPTRYACGHLVDWTRQPELSSAGTQLEYICSSCEMFGRMGLL